MFKKGHFYRIKRGSEVEVEEKGLILYDDEVYAIMINGGFNKELNRYESHSKGQYCPPFIFPLTETKENKYVFVTDPSPNEVAMLFGCRCEEDIVPGSDIVIGLLDDKLVYIHKIFLDCRELFIMPEAK